VKNGNGTKRPPLATFSDLEYAMGAALMLSLRAVPAGRRRPVIDRLSRLAGALLARASLSNVRYTRENLRRVFGEQLSAPEVDAHTRGALALAAWNAMVVDLLPALNDTDAAHLLEIEGTHHLDAVRARNKPTLLLGAHIGFFAYPIAAVLYARGYRLCEIGFGGQPKRGSSLLYQKVYWPRVAAMRQRFQVFDPHVDPQRVLLDVLKNNEILYLLPDEYYVFEEGKQPPPNLISVDFLGHTVSMETGAFRLAKRMGAELLTILPYQEHGRQHIPVEPLEYVTSGLSPADLAQDLAAFMARVEARIKAHPSLWRDLRRTDLSRRLRPKDDRP
jgi:lauroyl/myristoyl acyltransferase